MEELRDSLMFNSQLPRELQEVSNSMGLLSMEEQSDWIYAHRPAREDSEEEAAMDVEVDTEISN